MYKCLLWDTNTNYFGSCVQNLVLPSILFSVTLGLTLYTIFYPNQGSNIRRYTRKNRKGMPFMFIHLLLIVTMVIYIAIKLVSYIKFEDTIVTAVLFGLSSGFQIFLYYYAVKPKLLNYKILIVTSFTYFLFSLNPLQNAIKLATHGISSTWSIIAWILGISSFLTFILSLFLRPYEIQYDSVLINNSTNESNEVALELKSSIFGNLTFSWLSSIIKIGYKRSLTFTDLTPLHPNEESSILFEELSAAWNKEMRIKPPGQRSLMKVFIRIHWKIFITGSLLKIVYDVLLFSGPVFLKNIVKFLQDSNSTTAKNNEYLGFLYTAILFVAFISQTMFLHQYFHRMIRLGMRMRSALVSMIYDKSMKIPHGMAGKLMPDGTVKEGTPKSSGEIVNLMGVDTQRVQDLMTYVQIVWSGPFQITIAMILLYVNIGVSAFGGLGIAFLMIPLSGVISRRIKKVQNVVMKKRDDRLKITYETLGGIRILKMLAWENSFADKIIQQREIELGHLWKYQIATALSRMQWNLAPILILLVSFSIFILMGNVLTPDIAFTTLALVNILRFPMQLVPNMINNVMEALVSLNRIQDFLEIPPLKPIDINLFPPPSEPLIKIRNADFQWFNKAPLLKNINLDINKGELVAILGPTGSGKSGLLYSIIGDTEKLGGTLEINGTISYSNQVPWVQNCSVKDNICFKKAFNEYFYNKVIDACALQPDFEVLPAGDETEIGERGINLSGGQKQRIAMARALYHPADIYLFDDCFSALDANVAKYVFRKSFQDILKNKTVLLVTHKLDLLPYFDRILVINNNSIVYNGPYSGIHSNEVFQEFSASQGATEDEIAQSGHTSPTEVDSVDHGSISPEETEMRSKSGSEDGHIPLEQENNQSPKEPDQATTTKTKPTNTNDIGNLITTEQIFHGKVSKFVYWQYIKNAGIQAIFFYLLSQMLSNGSQMASSFWLSAWSDTSDSLPPAGGLSMYAILSFSQVFLSICALIYTSISSQNAAEKFHNSLIDGIMKAPISFFDTTPLGRILNRFSKDTNVIDEELPSFISSYVMTILNIGVIVISISIAVPLFLIPMVVLAGIYYYFQLYYIPTSRQLQRLDSVLKSPLFANFAETLDGAQTIRAFRYENNFLSYNQHLLDSNLKAYYLRVASNRWLAVRLESVGTGIVASTALLCVLSMGTISPSIAGLAISYSLNITQSLTNLVRVAGTLESSIVSVERVNEYINDLPQEPDQKILVKHTNHWPSAGNIKFVNFSLRYRPTLPLVLKNLNFEIPAGSKVGIVGRTGAGKSSLMTSLLRLAEPDEGFIEIDGVNTLDVNLKLLRSKFCIIPQSPTLFAGTLKFNVDPLFLSNDQEIMASLEKAHVKSFIEALSDEPLSLIVDEGGKNFSVGQRQMICLARAIISNAKIVMFDEATSVVDPHTDQLIQQTIKEEFKDSTILTIAHRINTILNSDKILVMENGSVAEFDSPENLFYQKDSIFRSMCLHGGVNHSNGEFTYDSSYDATID